MIWYNIHLIKSPIRREKRKWVFTVITEETMSDHFLEIMKDSPQIQKVQEIQSE